MYPSSALRELIETRLGMDVCAWVNERKAEQPGAGWRPLADQLEAVTGRRVSHATLANWCRTPDYDEPD